MSWEQFRGYLSYNKPMPRTQSPGLLIGKWVVIPVLLALLGYFVIGPRLGKVNVKPITDRSVPTTAPVDSGALHTEHASTTNSIKLSASAAPPPDLDITVHTAPRRTESVADGDHVVKHKHRHRKVTIPVDPPKPVDSTDTQQDQGGSAGSTTAG